MLELSDAVEGLDPSIIGTSPAVLAQAFALFSRLQAVLTEAVGVFDVTGVWAADDATSAAAWLKAFARLSGASATQFVAVARRLRALPVTAAALADGTLSCDQARAALGCVDGDLTDVFAEHEDVLVPVLAGLSVADVADVMRHWRERARRERPDPRPNEERRALHLSKLPDGTWRLDAALGAEGGCLLDDAVKLAASPDCEGEAVRTAAQRRADALVDVCRWFLDHRNAPPTTRRRPHLDAACTVTDLAEEGPARTANGTVVDAATLQRWACDASISRLLVRGRSHILDYGTATRVVPAALFLALVARDRHCRWPGCDRPPDWCDAHHLRHWTHGGDTVLHNLALFCTRHHHRLHHPDWQVRLDRSDATVTITTPTGRVLTSRPPPILSQLSFADTG